VRALEYLTFLGLLCRLHGKLARKLSPIFSEKGLSGTEAVTLWKIDRKGPWKTTDLAEHLGIPTSTFTGILDRLEARGFIQRKADPDDRRSIFVYGTPLLKEFMICFTQKTEEELRKILADLPENNLHLILEALVTLDRYLSSKEGKQS